MLDFFITSAYAMGNKPGGAAGQNAPGGGTIMITQIVIIIGIFYLLVFLPQKKEKKKRAEMLAAIKKNEKVITSSGIYGEIVELTDQYVILKIADNTNIKIVRSAISTVITETKELTKKKNNKKK